MLKGQLITPSLWFDTQAEEAATFYTSIFPRSRVVSVARYLETGDDVNRGMEGKVMSVAFELDGQPFTAINGGPIFTFSEATSFQIACETQAEVDHYWGRLSEGGDPAAQQCGWLKDRYGLSWQVIPTALPELIGGADAEGARRATHAMLGMKKLDIAELRRAYEGEPAAR